MKRRICKIGRRGLMTVALACAGHSAQAATLYWDINGTNAGAAAGGGSTAAGTWDTLTNNWNTASTGLSATTTWVNGTTSAAIFSAGTNATGTYNVTLGNSAAISVNSITFEEGTVTIVPGTSSTLTLSGLNPTISVAAGLTDKINQVMGGSSGLTTGGTGTLILGGQNTYSGSTNIYGASIKLGANNALPVDGFIGNVLTGANLNLNGFNQAADDPSVANLTPRKPNRRTRLTAPLRGSPALTGR